jgi:hypothetical protein
MRLPKLVFVAVLLTFAFGASAQQGIVEAVPSGWRLQNYVPNNIVLWFTGSPCFQGVLTLRSTATEKDRDRLYAMIMTAKTAGKRVVVYFTREGESCWIDSFVYKEE